jgi:NAD(P)-dependent dehydrogenase (short-subunit alcohol dehydrogenase family)
MAWESRENLVMMKHLFDLTGKKALVTGGAVGVGRACATALAMAGADVAIIGRTRDIAEKTCESLKRLGANACFVKCDVSIAEQVGEMTTEVVRRFGRIDIAVNNAGAAAPGRAMTMQREDWDRTLALNLSGVFWCAQAQARHMSQNVPVGGKIVNIASIYATVSGGDCAYNSSKAGVVYLTRSLAKEWGSENINVNCISPGWMLTPGNRHAITPELRNRMREVTPLGSLMRYQDIYGAVIYLSSAASDFVTGQELVIDGGHTVDTWLIPLERSVPARTSPEDEEIEMRMDVNTQR